MRGTYVVRLGTRLKIGYSADIPTRLKEIPHEEVISMIPSGPRLESSLHRRFRHLRVPLRNEMREWFEDDPSIRDAAAYALTIGEDRFLLECRDHKLPIDLDEWVVVPLYGLPADNEDWVPIGLPTEQQPEKPQLHARRKNTEAVRT